VGEGMMNAKNYIYKYMGNCEIIDIEIHCKNGTGRNGEFLYLYSSIHFSYNGFENYTWKSFSGFLDEPIKINEYIGKLRLEDIIYGIIQLQKFADIIKYLFDELKFMFNYRLSANNCQTSFRILIDELKEPVCNISIYDGIRSIISDLSSFVLQKINDYSMDSRKYYEINKNNDINIEQSECEKIYQSQEIERVPDKKYLYIMKDCSLKDTYKIGVSKNPQARESTLQAEKPTIKIVGLWENKANYENRWHRFFSQHRMRGEWFKLNKAQVKLFCLYNLKTDEELDNFLNNQ
jgi:hypothetical protein